MEEKKAYMVKLGFDEFIVSEDALNDPKFKERGFEVRECWVDVKQTKVLCRWHRKYFIPTRI